MRLAQRLQRLGPAFLAALVLVASLASAGHAHGVAAPAIAIQAAADSDATTAGDLQCALCANAQRLGHGEFAAHVAPAPIAHLHLHQSRADLGAIPRIDLDLSEARSPPRHG